MDELYTQYFDVLKAEDGNYYNDKAFKPALQYFKELQDKGEDLRILFPFLINIYDNCSNAYVQQDAACIFLNIAIKHGGTEQLFPLLNKAYGYYALVNALKKLSADGADIYTLFELVYRLGNKDVYGVPNIIQNYFEHEKYKDVRKSLKVEIAGQIASKKLEIYDMPGLIYQLLKTDFPHEGIEILAELISVPYCSFRAISALSNYLPEFTEAIVPVYKLIRDRYRLPLGIYQYEINEFLIKYAFYTNDDELIAELLMQPESALSRNSFIRLTQYIKPDIGKAKKFLPYYLEALKTDDQQFINDVGECLETFRSFGLELTADQLSELISRLNEQKLIAAALNVLKIFLGPEQLESVPMPDNPYLRALSTYLKDNSGVCAFCAKQAYTVYSDIKTENLNFYASIGEELNWAACKTCGQDYQYYYSEEIDVNSRHVSEHLVKTNPLELLNFKLSEEDIQKLKNSYQSKLQKAENDIFSPFSFLREPAADFLCEHYFKEKNAAALQELLAKAATEALVKILTKSRLLLNAENLSLLDIGQLRNFLGIESCHKAAAQLLTQLLVFKGDDAQILEMLQSPSTEIKTGTLISLLYPSIKDYRPTDQLLEAVYLCGIENPEALESWVSSVMKKYNYAAASVSMFNLMKIIELSADKKAVAFAFRYLPNKIDEVPAFNAEMTARLIFYLNEPEFRYFSLSLLTLLLKNNKINDDGFGFLLDYLKNTSKSLGYECIRALSVSLKASKQPYRWLNQLAEILNSPVREIRSEFILLVSEFAEMGISITPCLEVLKQQLNKIDVYENERAVYALCCHYYYHNPDSLTLMIDSLPEEKNKGQAIGRLADLAYAKKDISAYCDWLCSRIFAKNNSIQSSSRRALFYMLKHFPEQETKIRQALSAVAAAEGKHLDTLMELIKKL